MQPTLFPNEQPNKTPRQDRTQRFYADVRKEYSRLKNIKKNGVPLYSYEYILNEVAQKFYRSTKTIENIIWGRV